MRRFILACAGLLACASASMGGVQKATAAGQSIQLAAHSAAAANAAQARSAAIAWLGGQIRGYELSTWRWERLMGAPRTQTEGRVLTEMSIPDVEKALTLWKDRAHAAHVRAEHPPHLRQFLCIHHYEGSWTDSGSPYYGGLQMDLGFQHTYAPWLLRTKGTADHWTPLEQIWTAEKAARSRGFWPWPNTARMCGLL